MEEIKQKELDVKFAEITEIIKKRFHKKNMEYENAFLTVNDTFVEAFDDLKRIFDLLNIQIKYNEHLWDRDKFNKHLLDLATYSLMMYMFIEKFDDKTKV